MFKNTEILMKIYLYHILLDNYVPDYITAIVTKGIFRANVIKYGALIYTLSEIQKNITPVYFIVNLTAF